MSREDFLNKIRNMDPEEHERTTRLAEEKNPSFVRKMDRRSKIRKITSVAKNLGIGEAFYSSSIDSEKGHSTSQQSEFKEKYRVETTETLEPKINTVDVANAMAYYDGIYGKKGRDK